MKVAGVEIYFTDVKSAISPSGLPDIDYALNPYMGCSHSCIYCYARLYTRDERAARNWGSAIVVKRNLIEVLSKEVSRKKKGIVGVGTITDAYQPVEAVFKLTRKAVELLLRNGFYLSIQTKNPLVLRDVDLFSRYKGLVDVGFTITTTDSKLSSSIEPKAPYPIARMNALRKLSSLGVKTWIFYGPIIPGINDRISTIERLFSLAQETGSIFYYDPLHIKQFMREESHPLYEVVTRSSSSERIRELVNYIKKRCREEGIKCMGGFEEKRKSF